MTESARFRSGAMDCGQAAGSNEVLDRVCSKEGVDVRFIPAPAIWFVRPAPTWLRSQFVYALGPRASLRWFRDRPTGNGGYGHHITDECINCGACEPECPNGRSPRVMRLLSSIQNCVPNVSAFMAMRPASRAQSSAVCLTRIFEKQRSTSARAISLHPAELSFRR